MDGELPAHDLNGEMAYENEGEVVGHGSLVLSSSDAPLDAPIILSSQKIKTPRCLQVYCSGEPLPFKPIAATGVLC